MQWRRSKADARSEAAGRRGLARAFCFSLWLHLNDLTIPQILRTDRWRCPIRCGESAPGERSELGRKSAKIEHEIEIPPWTVGGRQSSSAELFELKSHGLSDAGLGAIKPVNPGMGVLAGETSRTKPGKRNDAATVVVPGAKKSYSKVVGRTPVSEKVALNVGGVAPSTISVPTRSQLGSKSALRIQAWRSGLNGPVPPVMGRGADSHKKCWFGLARSTWGTKK